MLIGCVFLASLYFSLLVESCQTLIHISHLDEMHHPIAVLCLGFTSVLINTLSYVLIGGMNWLFISIKLQEYLLFIQFICFLCAMWICFCVLDNVFYSLFIVIRFFILWFDFLSIVDKGYFSAIIKYCLHIHEWSSMYLRLGTIDMKLWYCKYWNSFMKLRYI